MFQLLFNYWIEFLETLYRQILERSLAKSFFLGVMSNNLLLDIQSIPYYSLCVVLSSNSGAGIDGHSSFSFIYFSFIMTLRKSTCNSASSYLKSSLWSVNVLWELKIPRLVPVCSCWKNPLHCFMFQHYRSGLHVNNIILSMEWRCWY